MAPRRHNTRPTPRQYHTRLPSANLAPERPSTLHPSTHLFCGHRGVQHLGHQAGQVAGIRHWPASTGISQLHQSAAGQHQNQHQYVRGLASISHLLASMSQVLASTNPLWPSTWDSMEDSWRANWGPSVTWRLWGGGCSGGRGERDEVGGTQVADERPAVST